MKTIYLIFTCLFFSVVGFSQDNINYKEYSYTEFFQLIKKEKDSVFKLEDALIIYNKTTDSRFQINPDEDDNINKLEKLIVDKKIELTNVQFLVNRYYKNSKYYTTGALKNIQFKKDVTFSNVKVMTISDCIFSGNFNAYSDNCDMVKLDVNPLSSLYISIENSFFYNRFIFTKTCEERSDYQGYVYLVNNGFFSDEENLSFNINLSDSEVVIFSKNSIRNIGSINLNFEGIKRALEFSENKITASQTYVALSEVNGDMESKNNNFSSPVFLSIDELKTKYKINWSQFKNKLSDGKSVLEYSKKETIKPIYFFKPKKAQEVLLKYLDSVRFYDKDAFSNEISIRGVFYEYYKSKYDTETANEVYLELKDFETQRLEILYQSNRNFRTYFRWKVNQFLKSFSDYGTDPSKAIVFSMYVIFIFAFIYLLFPNSWDKHGKNRIMNRYRFFTKYMNKEAGIHEVYLEDQKEDLLDSEDFKKYMLQAEKNIPKFFIATAIPLYKWSVSGTKISSGLLKRIDIMKGTWSDLPKSKRIWKSILLIGAFTVAVIYDILIKMLNALMLSINTFTTLGFGEIPIKGLPRYLAIIQGFIGWFMLTIFSVSLISQLLN